MYNWKFQVETICADDKTAISPSVLIQITCFWARFDWNVQPDLLPTEYLVPLAILSFLVHKMELNNMQVSYVSSWTCTFTTSTLKKIIWPDVHFQSQFNAPPGISIQLKNIWPLARYTFSCTNICGQSYRTHTPRVFLGTQETICASK